jgi:hypothetical protein
MHRDHSHAKHHRCSLYRRHFTHSVLVGEFQDPFPLQLFETSVAKRIWNIASLEIGHLQEGWIRIVGVIALVMFRIRRGISRGVQ